VDVAFFRDLPIRRALTWVNVATTAAVLLLASAAFVSYDIFIASDRLVRRQATQAEIIGYNAASAVMFEDRQAAAKTLTALRAEPQVLAAGIFTPDGAPFAIYRNNRHSLGPDFQGIVANGDGYRFVGDHLLVFRNIVVDGEVIGSVRLLSDRAEITATAVRHLGIAAVIFIFAIGASLPLLARLQRRISGPIMELVAKARIVSEQKDYSVRAAPAGNDELGLLVRTFNAMLAQIQERDQELEHARDEAEAANRAKDQFLAVVSHELRTPLSPVLLWTRMLRSGELDKERSARGLDVIERNVKSQAQLIEDLLDVSRIISGKLRLDVHPIEMGPVVEAAVESIRPTADLKGVRLHVIIDPRAVVLAGDPERLKQILWNLLSNAVKFTPKGGRVQIMAHRVNSHVEIAVSDTGKGIPPEFLPHVFDAFRQADSSSTRAHGGLGLGLSIVRHLTELHGGRVRAESPGDGQGATFTVELPVNLLHTPASVDRVHPTAAAPIASGPATSLDGLRVLAVDDDVDTLETLRTLLEQHGAEVRTAASVASALEVLDQWVPSLLISDIGMPDEDGYALIRKLRARPPERGGSIPALALTAYARVDDRLKVLSAGFQMHVPKPIEPAELIAVVHSLADWTVRRNQPTTPA
jgi:signal transduction histidine kinase/ActR/RegA family two-component response regulator